MIKKKILSLVFLSFFTNSLATELGTPVELKSTKINLFPTDFENISLNKLKFVSGIEIKSNHPDFGGLSGIIINEDKSLIVVGDRGIWLTGKIKIDENGKLVEIINGRLGHLKDNENNPLYKLGKSYTDAESIEPYNNKFVVSFERKHRILIFNNIFSHSEIFYDRIKYLDLPDNGGIEAMAPLKNNSIFLLSENLIHPDDKIAGYLLSDNKLKKVYVKKNGSFKPTDMSSLPEGNILLLERSFSPVRGASAKISVIKYEDLKPNSVILPLTLDTLKPPMVVDNFEGISFLKLNDGGYYIFILSDDNFNFLQKTLLYQFYWDGKL
tara:strand:+ start:486 stop:1460 length:975 start_codon:yes stop_codon:yes gene_type:complete